ncbi:uncharacterized protein N7487_008626 [Penicillium crustosum]|nr:uncharacterized protein N7487_008626 [Penicillium crustosum]KAJ5402730.1 hypothetical protein N7487_008626 [Penicillium crustosum]
MRPSMDNAREALDEDAPLGSESNPFLIYVEEDYDQVDDEHIQSDADTEIINTPEFWWEKMFRDSHELLADSTTDTDAEALTTPESWWGWFVDDETPTNEATAVDSTSIPLPSTTAVCEEQVSSYRGEKGSDQGSENADSENTDPLKLQALATNSCLSHGGPTAGHAMSGCHNLGTKKRQLLHEDGNGLRRSQRLVKRAKYEGSCE